MVRQTLSRRRCRSTRHVRVVLLIDDPPNPTTPAQPALLDAARALPGEIDALLPHPGRASRPRSRPSSRPPARGSRPAAELLRLAQTYDEAVAWLRETPTARRSRPHGRVLRATRSSAAGRRPRGRRPGAAGGRRGRGPSPRHARAPALPPAGLDLPGEVTSFERKLYSSLSQESNKAMNLNSYIGLMGHSFEVRATPEGRCSPRRRRSRLDGAPTPTTCSPSTPTASSCRNTACGWSMSSRSRRTRSWPSSRRRTRRSPGRPPGWSDCPARPPISSTSSTRE